MSIDKIRNIGLDKLITQVYDFDSLTTDELMCKFAQKINIIIEHFNYLDKHCQNSIENMKLKLEYLLEQGLDEHVSKKLMEVINDGTIKKLINENILKELDTKTKQLDKKIDEVAQTGTTTEIVQNKVSEMAQNGSITFNTVTPEMTTFIDKIGASNLYSNAGYIDNKRVNENGQLVEWNYCFTLELFRVKRNTTYSFSLTITL